MLDNSTHVALKLCLVTEDRVVESAVRVTFPPPHEMEVFSADGIVGSTHTLSEYGRAVAQAALDSDFLLLDWTFDRAPVLNTLCFHVRKEVSTPIIALCKGSHEDQVAAIAAGADDTLNFPLYPSLLQAKLVSYRRLVEAVRVHVTQSDGEGVQDQVERESRRKGRRFGELYLDRASHRFFIRDKEVEVTPREFALLDYLIENANTACTRDAILDRVWGINFDTGTNMVDVYMYFLRRKLEAHGLKGMIQTVRGYGYRMGLPESEAT